MGCYEWGKMNKILIIKGKKLREGMSQASMFYNQQMKGGIIRDGKNKSNYRRNYSNPV